MEILKDEDIKHYIKVGLIALVSFLIAAAGFLYFFRANYTIRLSAKEIDYGEKISITSLVDAVGRTKINKSNIVSGNTIKLEETEISFDEYDPYKIGDQDLKVYFSNPEIDDQEIRIKIVDHEKPVIEFLKEDRSEISLEDAENSKFESLFVAKDNATNSGDLDLKVSSNLDEYAYGDNFEIKVTAVDESGNKAEKSLKLKIEDEPEKEETKEVIDEEASIETTDEEINESSEAPSSAAIEPMTPSKPITTPPADIQQVTVPKPSNKQYLFSAGYDMQTAPSACGADLNASGYSGTCRPLQGADGIYIGMELIFD